MSISPRKEDSGSAPQHSSKIQKPRVGLTGNKSMQADEIVEVIQDLITEPKKCNEDPLLLTLDQLEQRLVIRGGEYFIGNNLTLSDICV